MRPLWEDLRFGLRLLRRHPSFSILTLMTLALGIGANTAVFSIVRGVLLKPLPYRQPEQLLWFGGREARFEVKVQAFPSSTCMTSGAGCERFRESPPIHFSPISLL